MNVVSSEWLNTDAQQTVGLNDFGVLKNFRVINVQLLVLGVLPHTGQSSPLSLGANDGNAQFLPTIDLGL